MISGAQGKRYTRYELDYAAEEYMMPFEVRKFGRNEPILPTLDEWVGGPAVNGK